MSEKIVQLNEEVIKDQLKELVRGSVEETLNELLEQEAEKLTQAARYERSEARRGYRSGRPSSSGIAAGKAVWRKLSLRCIWQVSPCAVWRTSPRHCGAARFRPLPSVS